MLWEGHSSFVFIPKEHPNCVIKIIKKGCKPYGVSPEEEYDLLKKLLELKGELFITPTPRSRGSDPVYIAMDRLGKVFGWGVSDPNEVKRIGLAVGEFAGLLFLKHGSIHTDICLNNYTNGFDGKIGIIDIASIEKTDVPERMFLCPILDPFNICLAMADKFEEVTGRPIDSDLFEKLSKERMEKLFEGRPPNVVSMIQGRHDANLEELVSHLRGKQKSCHRPVATQDVNKFRMDI